MASCNANGLCVIKKLLAVVLNMDLTCYQHDIIEKICSHSIEMAQNPYGNYAVQIVLETFPHESTNSIVESIKGKLIQLSIMKYSSNVVERCLENSLPPTRDALLREIIESESFLGK